MTARVLKCEIIKKIQASSSILSSDHSIISTVLAYLNEIVRFGNVYNSPFWTIEIKQLLKKKYQFANKGFDFEYR